MRRLLGFATLLLANASFGQEQPEISVLAHADTSSPRATLETFQTNVSLAFEPGQDGVELRDYQALRRAAETLDFSAMPREQSITMQIERVALLKELFDRIAIPEELAIPGSEAVAGGGVTEWFVPGTRIRIAQVTTGRAAGRFLFSAGTVEQLDRLYRLGRSLPYRPGAMRGLYDAVTQADESIFVVEERVRDRLQPVNTASPRATLEQLIASVNEAYALVMAAEAASNAEPPADDPT
ncbi:MAG: hypothetical protein AAGE01_02530 [Pseudomonadota bacterium]